MSTPTIENDMLTVRFLRREIDELRVERDAWKAKANASQQMVDALLKRGHVTRPSWGYHDGAFSIHIPFKAGECGDDDIVSRNNLLKRLLD